jgi:hypothetical protein
MGLKIQDRESGKRRIRGHMDMMDLLITVAFDCSETSGIVPSAEIVDIVHRGVSVMVDVQQSLEIPPILLDLLDPVYPRAEVCAALVQKRDRFNRKLEYVSETSDTIRGAMKFYNYEIRCLSHPMWGVFPTRYVDNDLYSQLVQELIQLRYILDRDSTLRSLVGQNLDRFSHVVKVPDVSARMSEAVTRARLEALLHDFVQSRNLDAFTHGVMGVYRHSSLTLTGLNLMMCSLANSLRKTEKGATATRVLNIENILIRGVEYVPKNRDVL